jgi:hypothetical protein
MKNKKKIFITLCVVAVSVGLLAFNGYLPTKGQTSATQPAPTQTAPGTRQSPRLTSAPEHVVYKLFFHHLMALKERAKEMERQGKNGKALRSHYKDAMGLKDEEASILDQIAADCERDVAQIDARAKKIIDAAYARNPKGVIPEGQEVPPPPPQLHKMQEERDMIIMRARYKLLTKLGKQGFQQVDDFLKLHFAPDVKPAQMNPGKSPNSPQTQPGGIK